MAGPFDEGDTDNQPDVSYGDTLAGLADLDANLVDAFTDTPSVDVTQPVLLRLQTRDLTQGGTLVAAFVSPHFDAAKPGSIDDGYLTVMDIAPTLLELAGIARPEGTDGTVQQG